MRLAKSAIDVGVQTHRREQMPSFWQDEVGLPFDHMLRVGGGVQQHRHEMNGSVPKLNHSREPHEFYAKALELEPLGDNAYCCGHSVLLFAKDASAGRAGDMRGWGYRYITIQVWDVDAEHRRMLAAGAEEGRAPVTLGKVARISFVRDPDGNWIEISQRASLTGPVE